MHLRATASFKAAARPCAARPCLRRCLVAPVRAEYKFGDLTRGLMKGAKEQLDKLGQTVTGDEGYHFGDLTRKTLGSLIEQNAELRQMSADAVEALRNYRFGDVTKALLNTEWGQEVVSQAQEAGRKLTGRADYQVGDLSREALSRLSAAQDRAAKLLSLPNEVETLKQIVVEQQILLNSLAKKEGSQEQAKELMALTGSADELKPLILEQQQVIDVMLASVDEANKAK